MKHFDGYNDLHNTHSAKKHKPSSPELDRLTGRPKYKKLFDNQLNNNKILLWVVGISWVIFLTYGIGQSMRYKYELARVQSLATTGLEQADQWSQYAQALENKILYPDTQSIESIIETVFKNDAGVMKKIAYCESHLNPKAKNKSSSATGLFQILSQTHNVNARYLEDPMINALIAKKLFDASGTNPWVSSISCWGK